MKKIAIFTATRAEYGLLYELIKKLADDNECELQLIVGGMHLSSTFGFTLDHIIKDGFRIAEILEFLVSGDTPTAISKSMGLAQILASEALERLKPDMLVLLGDRFEALSMAQAAMIAQVPIAHIHGGERTEGAVDEAIRHSITKMSHLHFTSTNEYRQRVIQLGEQPDRVFNVGAPGIDKILATKLKSLQDLTRQLDFDLTNKFFLITYHPVTLEKSGAVSELDELFLALNKFPDYKLVITYPNADVGNGAIIRKLEEFALKSGDRVLLSHSLGSENYFSLINHCSCVVGNSSSGLLEVPTLQKPTVNIGYRQKGRVSGKTVINCDGDRLLIEKAIEKSVSTEFSRICKKAKNPYGDGGASQKIFNTLKGIQASNLLSKTFYDISFG